MKSQAYIIAVIVTFIAALVYSIVNYRKYYIDEFRKRVRVDISLDEMHRIEELVSATKEAFRLDDDTELDVFAQAIHVKEGKALKRINNRAQIKLPSIDGFMYVDYSSKLSHVDRRFALAHECGHVLNHHPIPNTQQLGHGKPENEQIADYTAAAIIMPKNRVVTFLHDTHYDEMSTRQKKKLISKMCKQFDVSESSAIKRIKEVKMLISDT